MSIEDTAGAGVGLATQTAYAGVGLKALNKAAGKRKRRRKGKRAYA